MTLLRLLSPLLAPAILASTVGAQGAAAPNTAVSAALDRIKAEHAWTIEQQVSICEIPRRPSRRTRAPR